MQIQITAFFRKNVKLWHVSGGKMKPKIKKILIFQLYKNLLYWDVNMLETPIYFAKIHTVINFVKKMPLHLSFECVHILCLTLFIQGGMWAMEFCSPRKLRAHIVINLTCCSATNYRKPRFGWPALGRYTPLTHTQTLLLWTAWPSGTQRVSKYATCDTGQLRRLHKPTNTSFKACTLPRWTLL